MFNDLVRECVCCTLTFLRKHNGAFVFCFFLCGKLQLVFKLSLKTSLITFGQFSSHFCAFFFFFFFSYFPLLFFLFFPFYFFPLQLGVLADIELSFLVL